MNTHNYNTQKTLHPPANIFFLGKIYKVTIFAISLELCGVQIIIYQFKGLSYDKIQIYMLRSVTILEFHIIDKKK